MAELDEEQPESLEEIVRRVLGEQKTHGHRQWGPGVRTAIMCPRFVTDAVLAQAAPVQNTWYTVLDAVNVRLYIIGVRIDTTGETLQVRVTLDGVVLTGAATACVAGTNYFMFKSGGPTIDNNAVVTNAAVPYYVPVLTNSALDARRVLVEVRKTTNAGVGQLNGRVVYAAW